MLFLISWFVLWLFLFCVLLTRLGGKDCLESHGEMVRGLLAVAELGEFARGEELKEDAVGSWHAAPLFNGDLKQLPFLLEANFTEAMLLNPYITIIA